ncbi:MAG TPA: RsmB/NOP family class I SAM-dependent RNA methyltransferase [Verrucomicrobiae bacterium]|nr:RsmB/NOP family class I SAM-dependent RNA methyltransferase [Verrucomicrobiae bacterium]
MGDNFKLAADVIAAAEAKPADQALRQVLKAHRQLPPWDAAEISQIVFAFYRWQGWIREAGDLEAQLRRARALAHQFDRKPDGIPLAELRERAVPSWVHEQVAVSEAWLKSLQQQPRLWLRARKGQGSGLARTLQHCERAGDGPLSDTLEYQGEEDLFRSTAFHAGDFEVQDISSQAVGFICDPLPGETWWDACAGEGGKLLHLSDLMENRGLIWASDRADWRLKNLKRRAGRAKAFNYRAAPWDGGAKLPTKTKFDGVLVDAPCSGVGTWQRNPHARWTTELNDVAELSAVQVRLLAHAAQSVKPGGKLIYSVCTLTRAETDDVADAFDKQAKDFEPLPMRDPLGILEAPASRIWYWPQECRGNGMYVAAWRRKSAS